MKIERRKSVLKKFLPQSPDTLPFACTLLGPAFGLAVVGVERSSWSSAEIARNRVS